MCICGAGSQKYGVRVPRDSCDGTPNRLLDMFRDPPVILLLEIADSDYPGAGSYCEFRLRWRPADEGGGAVDSKKNKSRFIT